MSVDRVNIVDQIFEKKKTFVLYRSTDMNYQRSVDNSWQYFYIDYSLVWYYNIFVNLVQILVLIWTICIFDTIVYRLNIDFSLLYRFDY